MRGACVFVSLTTSERLGEESNCVFCFLPLPVPTGLRLQGDAQRPGWLSWGLQFGVAGCPPLESRLLNAKLRGTETSSLTRPSSQNTTQRPE